MANTLHNIAFTAAASFTADSFVKADNGICHGRVLRARNETTGNWDIFTAQLIDTSAQTQVEAGPFDSLVAAEARIVSFLIACADGYRVAA